MSFFDEVETTVANTRFLQAVEDNGPIILSLTPYDELKEWETDFVKHLTSRRLLKYDSVGYYLYRQFLEQDVKRPRIVSVTQQQPSSPSNTSTHLHPLSASPTDTKDHKEMKQDPLSILTSLDDYMKVHQGQRKRHALRIMNHILHFPRPSDLDKEPQLQPGEMPPSQILVKSTRESISSDMSSTGTIEPITSAKLATNTMIHLPEEGAVSQRCSVTEETKENDTTKPNVTSPKSETTTPDPLAKSTPDDPLDKSQPTPEPIDASQPTTPEQISPEQITPEQINPSVPCEPLLNNVDYITPPTPKADKTKKISILASEDTGRREATSSIDDEVEGTPAVFITNIIPPSPTMKEGHKKLSFNAPGLPGSANSSTPTSPTISSSTSTSSNTPPSSNSFVSQLITSCRSSLYTIWRILESTSHPPTTLFDSLRDALGDLLQESYTRFLQTDGYKKYIQLEHYARRQVQLKDFRVFRVLGRGAFGAVSAVQKIDTHAIFAMKEMGKKQVKQNQSEWMVLNEKKVLSKMRSPFVLNLKYSFHNEENLYLIFDMCSGGDLKFHLRGGRDKFFDNDRARFYAAEVLLGLEHIHSFDIVYRDLKPNNILLDMNGHVKISDLGLTIRLRKNKVLKHLAGTAGYWAPEIVMKKGTYKSSDYWSFGTFLYEMLAGKRPSCTCAKKTNEWCPFGQKRSMEDNALKDDGILKMEIEYPADKFTPEAKDLLEKLFEFDPSKRLGANGAHEIKQHPYFASIDWHALQALEVEPPFIPDGRTVNANSIGEVGEFNKGKFKKIKLTEEDEKGYTTFDYINDEAVQQELVQALKKQDNPSAEAQQPQQKDPVGTGCCTIL